MDGVFSYYNPIRYRGYYYDTETGLYYLQSRYYNPEMGRFINADAFASTGQGILGNNMFVYYNNNPVNMVDAQGNWPRWITAAVAVVSAVVAAAGAYVVQSVHYDDREQRNQDVPKTYGEAMSTPGADNSISAACHQFTSKDDSNVKVCWPDEKEAIYDSNGNLVTDPRDVGTYNYFIPVRWECPFPVRQ